jgi:hypothetical protein
MNSRLGIIHLLCSVMAVLLFCDAAWTQSKPSPLSEDKCRIVGKGVEYCLLEIKPEGDRSGARIHVLRIEPNLARLKLLLASEHDNKSRTAAAWCRDFGLLAAINAGMYGKDFLTNVGYLQNGTYIQNKRWSKGYKSVLAFESRKTDIPQAIMIDLDEPEAIKKVQDYNVVIQNLRLIKGDGVNVWGRSEKKWSEAAVGMDKSGRILFLFCRSPYSMVDFNEIVKSSGLAVMKLMHMEGGPVASMSVRSRNLNLDISGSYETGMKQDDMNEMQWPIPNVIGVQIK